MFNKKNWLVILVEPHALVWLMQGMNSPQTLTIPVAVINNLEVINRDELYVLIADWTKSRTYTTTEIIWLLAPGVYFEQTFPDSEKDKWDSATVQFLDTVPFEEVVSRVYSPVNGRQVVALNKDLITSLMQAFTLHGYPTRAVVPASFVTSDVGLTPAIAHAAMNHLSELTRDSLISDGHTLVPATPSQIQKPKSMLPLLIAVFGVLVAILLFVLYLNH